MGKVETKSRSRRDFVWGQKAVKHARKVIDSSAPPLLYSQRCQTRSEESADSITDNPPQTIRSFYKEWGISQRILLEPVNRDCAASAPVTSGLRKRDTSSTHSSDRSFLQKIMNFILSRVYGVEIERWMGFYVMSSDLAKTVSSIWIVRHISTISIRESFAAYTGRIVI